MTERPEHPRARSHSAISHLEPSEDIFCISAIERRVQRTSNVHLSLSGRTLITSELRMVLVDSTRRARKHNGAETAKKENPSSQQKWLLYLQAASHSL